MLPFLQDVRHGVSVECMELVTSWQCVVSSIGDALCMVCNVWNITQVEAKCCLSYRMSNMVSLKSAWSL